jgi:hypothetical protein
MLNKEFKYYRDNQQKLTEKYLGKFLIIKGQRVVGTFDDHIIAYETAKDKYGLGNFLLQHCLPGEANISRTFHSQVILNE